MTNAGKLDDLHDKIRYFKVRYGVLEVLYCTLDGSANLVRALARYVRPARIIRELPDAVNN